MFISVYLKVFDFTGLAIISAILGISKTFIQLPVQIIFAEHLSMERYTIDCWIYNESQTKD